MTTPGSVAFEPPIAAAPSPYLERYLSVNATVYYASGVTDTGHITHIDNFWLELTKENKDVLLIPVSSIRIVKVLDPVRLRGDSGILLRASDGGQDDPRKQIDRE